MHFKNNKMPITGIKDPLAAAMVINNSIENVAITARFNSSNIEEEERLLEKLVEMISGFLLGSHTPSQERYVVNG